MLRTVVYVDGQNLHYNLETLGLQEKDVDWGRVFADLVPKEDRLIRVNWYQAARIASWSWNARYHSKMCPNGMKPDEFQVKAEEYYRSECERLDKLHDAVYGRIEENFDAIEFRYAGVLKVDPVCVWESKPGVQRVGKRVGEKGVDVGLAVDMVRQAAEYDHAILVSGDFDYVPALQAVKDMLRSVTVVSVMKGTPPKHQGHARRLRGLCDVERQVFEADLKGKYKFSEGTAATKAP